MVIVSVLLSFVAFASMGLGLVLTVVPIWGAVFSFGAPAIALLGIVLGGIALSAASKQQQPTGFAVAAVVMNTLAMVPAIVVAMTCGVCNAMVTTGSIQTHQNFQWTAPMQLQPTSDASVPNEPPPPPPLPDDTQRPRTPDAPSTPELPPPPLDPGPTR